LALRASVISGSNCEINGARENVISFAAVVNIVVNIVVANRRTTTVCELKVSAELKTRTNKRR